MTFRKLTLIATLAAVTALQMGAAPAMAKEKPGRITITGEGSSESAPDLASVNLGVSSQGATAAEALAANSRQLAAVLERLKAQGIADRDLQTSGLNLGPRQEYSNDGKPPQIVGYEASNMVTVRVRDLAKLGGILDAAVGDGANTFNGLSFALSEPGPALDQARDKAVSDARRKAEQIATAAGVKLGRILEIREGGGAPEPRPMFARDAAMAAAPIQGGEVGYSVSVTISWEIAQE